MLGWLGWIADLLLAIGGIIAGWFVSKDASSFTGIQTMVAMMILTALVASIAYGQSVAEFLRHGSTHGQPGSRPRAAMTAAAPGVLRKPISARADAGSCAPVSTAAVKTSVFCRSAGSAPTTSTPASGISSWTRLIPISACPPATRTPA